VFSYGAWPWHGGRGWQFDRRREIAIGKDGSVCSYTCLNYGGNCEQAFRYEQHLGGKITMLLAFHVAAVPGGVAEFVASPSPAQAPQFTDPSPRNASDLIPALEESITKAKAALARLDDAAVLETWRLMQGDRELFAVPRIAMLRSVMLNHWYHDRGQLTVYLRALDAPVPSIYGPSADENPFA
jgi:uncharacterized damage-inducible protein DinB